MTERRQPEPPRRLTQIHELDQLLAADLPAPERLSRKAHGALPDDERHDYDETRRAYIASGILLPTPGIYDAIQSLDRIMALSGGHTSGHGGLLVSGPAGTGKSTLLTELMRHVRGRYAEPTEDPLDQTVFPVLYVKVPAASSAKAFIRAMADTLAMSYRDNEDVPRTRANVIEKLDRCGVRLICVDELQNLTGRGRSHNETFDVLKGLHDDIRATFVYAGIEISKHGFFSGPRGEQIRSRFTDVDLDFFDWALQEDRDYWIKIVAAFETRLPLIEQAEGSLTALAGYLHDRTGGSIGSLARLVRMAAQEAITTGTEYVDRAALEKITIDMRAEEHYALRQDLGDRAEAA